MFTLKTYYCWKYKFIDPLRYKREHLELKRPVGNHFDDTRSHNEPILLLEEYLWARISRLGMKNSDEELKSLFEDGFMMYIK